MIVSSEYPPNLIGGLGTHVSELAKGLGRSGCQVNVLAPAVGKTAVDTTSQNVTANLISINDIINDPGLTKYVEKVAAFNQRAVIFGRALMARDSQRPDVIHCHDWLGFSTAYQLGRIFSIPVVATIHLLYEPIFKRWGQEIPGEIIREERNLCQDADRLISVSQSM